MKIDENLVAAGVIDPLKMVRLTLQNALSVAGLMTPTEALITEKPKKKRKWACRRWMRVCMDE